MNIGEISFFQDSTTGQIYPGKEKKKHKKNRREILRGTILSGFVLFSYWLRQSGFGEGNLHENVQQEKTMKQWHLIMKRSKVTFALTSQCSAKTPPAVTQQQDWDTDEEKATIFIWSDTESTEWRQRYLPHSPAQVGLLMMLIVDAQSDQDTLRDIQSE